MLKLKHQYFDHLMQRANSQENTLMLGKIEGRRRGQQRMRWLDGITNSMGICTYVSSLLNLPPTLSHLYRLLQSPSLISLSHTVNFIGYLFYI